MIRRFECVNEKSNKFWEVCLDKHPLAGIDDGIIDEFDMEDGINIVVRYGKIGTNGQVDVKSFPDKESAEKHVSKVISQKIKKGYCETALV